MELENGTETAMKDYYNVCLERINQLILRVRGVLPKITRQKFITVITVDVHGRDVVNSFRTRVPAIEGDSFDW
jgi:dynein heavy chain